MAERLQVLSIRVKPEVYDWVVAQAARMTLEQQKRVTLAQVSELAIRKMMKAQKKK